MEKLRIPIIIERVQRRLWKGDFYRISSFCLLYFSRHKIKYNINKNKKTKIYQKNTKIKTHEKVKRHEKIHKKIHEKVQIQIKNEIKKQPKQIERIIIAYSRAPTLETRKF